MGFCSFKVSHLKHASDSYEWICLMRIGGSKGGSQGASEPPFCQIHVSLTTEFSSTVLNF